MGSRKGSFELAIAAYDVQGRVLNSLDEKRSFTLKPDAVAAFLQKPFVVPVEIDLPTGALLSGRRAGPAVAADGRGGDSSDGENPTALALIPFG